MLREKEQRHFSPGAGERAGRGGACDAPRVFVTRAAAGMSTLRVVPPLAWTAMIAWFSTAGWSAVETASVLLPLLRWFAPSAGPEQLEAFHWLVRKTAHAAEYGTLGALWRWALGSRGAWRGWLAPLGLSILTAALDELHQSTTLTRTGSLGDVVLDSAGRPRP